MIYENHLIELKKHGKSGIIEKKKQGDVMMTLVCIHLRVN
jgi:hypothetical protein